MDWKTLGAAFAMTFLAEFGDKTQIALFTMTAQGKPRVPVLLGGCAALVTTTILAVAAGALVQGFAGERFGKWVRIAAGIAFLAMGALMLFGREE